MTLGGGEMEKKKDRECPPIDRKTREEFLTVNMILHVIIGFQLSLLKGISVGKQLEVKRKELLECFKNNVGYALGLRIKRMMSK